MAAASPAAAQRARLLALQRRTLERLAALEREHARIVEATELANTDDEHDPEGATIAFERAQVAELRRSATLELTAIDAALARVEAGTFGTCAACGGVIPPERLEARPTTDRCVACSR
jgi:DnaK suppressor protein